jgi:ketosteroid isomerase-like protein
MKMNDLELEIWTTVESLNRCWTEGAPEELRNYFHETMVAVTPGDTKPLHGRDACMAAWSKYAGTTRIISWKTSMPSIQVYDQTAVVTYLYDMECERDGRRFRPSGRDMMVLVKQGGRWWLAADHFSPVPAGSEL